MNLIPESQVQRETGYTRQQLHRLRTSGESPVLREKKHWVKFGGAVGYTPDGVFEIHRWAAKKYAKAKRGKRG